uniref:Uncharacterized protein n=1 Tax=Edwardsiella ictaluri TaxID=67780 RepID=A0A7U3Q705_EDWIC|nr:hypothetical protein [Edwardsiella ictaluri]
MDKRAAIEINSWLSVNYDENDKTIFTITPARRTASDALSAILRRYRQKTQLRTPKTAKIAQDDSGVVA